jgi:ADP-ribose pyrophosphatase YjhB (NUDIX family)
MTSSLPAGASFAAWTAQRVEVYAVVPGVEGGPALLDDHAGRPPRVPGVVLAHGEHPRDAARRALTGPLTRLGAAAPALAVPLPAPEAFHLRQVLSDVRVVPGRVGLHVLRLVLEADHGLPVVADPARLVDPDPAPVTDRIPGAPPRVQRPAAYAVVVQDGEILLSRAAGIGVWTLPGGGIDHGEHPHDAVRREVFEETGLHLTRSRLVDVDSRHFTGRGPDRITEDFHGVRILYVGEVTGRPDPQVQEVGGSTDAAAWVPVAQLSRWRTNELVRTAAARFTGPAR